MTERSLYSCHPAGEAFRITKLDHDLNVIASYLTTRETCDCPAGVRDTCRHRKMLPRFIARGFDWLLDHDAGEWHRAEPEQSSFASLPEGVTVLGLDNLRALHNTIAEAVGESPEPPTKPTRIFLRRV
jgi:hypothetical protein